MKRLNVPVHNRFQPPRPSLRRVFHRIATLLLALNLLRILHIRTSQPPLLKAALHTPSQIRIFIYDLPPKYNTLQVSRSILSPPPIRDPNCATNFYSAEPTIHSLLQNSPYRTHNPSNAHFFYVPIYATCYLLNNHPNNLTRTGIFFTEAMSHITTHHPYFNASSGRDHVYVFAQGFGARLAGPNWARWRNGIFLVHNGDFSTEEYTPHKDLVVPPNLSAYLTPVYLDQTHPPIPLHRRVFLAHFGGQTFPATLADHRGTNYSRGVRQFLADFLAAAPGFRITPARHPRYLHDIRRSLFCLAPEGWHAWSPRPYYAILLGCVPVVISERQELAFEDVVPYDEFVVWIRPADVRDLARILRAIPMSEILRRLRVMEDVWRLFWYEPGTGAAIDAIVAQLSRRKYAARPRRRYLDLASVSTWRNPN